jgi:uncharacterized GH25 family protein
MRGLLLLPALLLLLLSGPAQAADLTKIKIVVMTPSGKPIDRASVIVTFGGRSIVKFGKLVRTSWEVRTSQEGSVDIPEMPKGKLRVQVIAKGYQTFGQTFDVDEDQRTIEVKLNLPQAQYSVHEAETSKK